MDALLTNLRNEIRKQIDERRTAHENRVEALARLQQEQEQNERERQAAARLSVYRRNHPLPTVALVA